MKPAQWACCSLSLTISAAFNRGHPLPRPNLARLRGPYSALLSPDWQCHICLALSLGHHNLSLNLDSPFPPPNCSPCSAQGPVNHTVPVAQTWVIFHAALFLPVPDPTHHCAPERLPREYLSSLPTSLFLPHCHPHHHPSTVLLPPPNLMYTPSPPHHVSSALKPPSLHPPAHHPTHHPSPPPSPTLHPAAHQCKLPLLFIRFSGLVSKLSNLTHSCPLLIQLDL